MRRSGTFFAIKTCFQRRMTKVLYLLICMIFLLDCHESTKTVTLSYGNTVCLQTPGFPNDYPVFNKSKITVKFAKDCHVVKYDVDLEGMDIRGKPNGKGCLGDKLYLLAKPLLVKTAVPVI